MSVESYRESPGKFDSRTLNRKTLNRWTGRTLIRQAVHPIGWRHLSNATCLTRPLLVRIIMIMIIYIYIYIYPASCVLCVSCRAKDLS